jgi:hypothetical protein
MGRSYIDLENFSCLGNEIVRFADHANCECLSMFFITRVCILFDSVYLYFCFPFDCIPFTDTIDTFDATVIDRLCQAEFGNGSSRPIDSRANYNDVIVPFDCANALTALFR